jgi:phage terminase large subunit-like protein
MEMRGPEGPPSAAARSSNAGAASSQVTIAELVKLSAINNGFFARQFFPKAARQRDPAFFREADELLDNPRYRYVNLRFFRGAAKTTKLRMYTAKRAAYATSRTILYVGASEGHAVRSIMWLRSAITVGGEATGEPTFFGKVFGLKPGRKWTESEIEVHHGVLGNPIWVLGVGITGNIRGINFENYRPDLILLDDVVTDENAATKEQREKISDLVFGAIKNSLAPATEEPNAKLAILQSPIDSEDISALAERDAQFETRTFGCWTKETADLPLYKQESCWPERYPTEELRADKAAAINRGRLSIFLREMECKLVAPELCPLKPEWLRYYEDQAPLGGMTVLAVDPVPPASDVQLAKNLQNKDFEAQGVWRRVKGEYYLVDLVVNRGHDPNWSVNSILQLARDHRVSRIVLQRFTQEKTLKWLIEQEMRRRGMYFVIEDTTEKQGISKFKRIEGTLAGPASQGHLWVSKRHTDFIEQWTNYRPGKGHDDILDMSATALTALINPYLELGVDDYADLDDLPKLPALKQKSFCP